MATIRDQSPVDPTGHGGKGFGKRITSTVNVYRLITARYNICTNVSIYILFTKNNISSFISLFARY